MNITVVQVRVSLFTRNMADEAIARVDEEYSGMRSPIFFFIYMSMKLLCLHTVDYSSNFPGVNYQRHRASYLNKV